MPQTVTIAQALQSNQSGLTVQDTAANIAAALPNAGLVSRVSVFELSGAAVAGTAAADKLATLGGKFVPGYPITVQDSVAAMNLAANASGLALASSRQIIDAAYNLLAAAPSAFHNISAVLLSGAPTLSVAQIAKLETLPGFTTAPGTHIVFSDSLAALAPALIAHPTWFTLAGAVTIRLDGTQVGAGVATALAALVNAGKTVAFATSPSDATLNINATAHDLASAAASLNRIGQLVGVHIHVANDGSAISAADAVALTGIAGFSPAQHTLYVADTGAAITAAGAALFNHGYPQIVVVSGNFSGIAAQLLDPTLHVLAGATVTMTGHPTLNAAQMQVLSGLPGFALAAGTTLSVTDTISHLVAHAGAMGPATAITVTDSETTTAAGLSALAGLRAAHANNFTLGGHTVTAADTPANLAGLSADAIALSSGFSLTGNGAVSVAQMLTLRDSLHVVANGHSVVVSDTAANLLSLSGNLTLVSATQLGADAQISAMQAQTLAAGIAFSTAGHALTIADTATALLGLPSNVVALAAHLALNSNQAVSGAQAQALAALGSAFSTAGQALVVTDSAATLLALPAGVTAIATGYGLSADATVSGAQFTTLIGTLAVALNGHGLTVADTPANLLAIASQLDGQASAFVLSASGSVNAAQFATLRDGLHVSPAGNTLVVADTASALLSLSGNLSLVSATQLSANASVSAAQAQALAAEPGFSTGGHVLSVVDTAAGLLGLAPSVQALAGHLLLSGDGSVNVSQAQALVALGSVFSDDGHALIVTGSAADLLSLSPGVAALATGYGLSGDASVTAGQFATLVGTLAVARDGHALSVTDTAANLLGLSPMLLGQASGFALSADGSVSQAQFVTLRDGLGVAGNGHTLTVADTASGLLALSGDLALVGATQLASDATVNAAQAQSLAGEPNFGTGGHVLTIVDTAASLLSLSGAVQGLAGALVLSASQSVSATQASALVTLGASFSTGGYSLTVSDTAAALLGLPAGVAAIASAYVLSADATVSAGQFAALASTLNVALGGHSLIVADSPANLLALPQQTYAQASGFALSAGGTVSEAQFVTLRDAMGVAADGHTLTVADTASDLLALSGNLALDGATQLSADANVSAAQAQILAAEPSFSTGGHVLTVTDSAANLLGLPGAVQALSGQLVLAASQSVSAAQAASLAAFGASFSTGGHSLTVSDTAVALLALPSGVGAIATAYALSADASVSEAQLGALSALGVALAGHALIVSDTPANLLSLSSQLTSQATGFALDADGIVSEAQFLTLRDTLGVAANGNSLNVTDSAANLLALSGNLSLIGSTTLSADANLSASAATTLAGEPGFASGGHVLSVTDTAAALLALPAGVLAVATAYGLSADAIVTAAQLSMLATSLNVSLNGHALTVADTPANLLNLPIQVLSDAAGFVLSAGGTVSEAQFTTLRDVMGVSGNGHTLVVSDSAAHLLSLSGDLSLVSATQLSADANVSAGQAQSLAAEPNLATGGHILTVTDTAAALLALPSSMQTLSGHLVLAASQSVSAAQATALAALGGAFSTGGHVLTATDTATNLLSLPPGAGAIVGAYALSSDAAVSASQFTSLVTELNVGLNGHALTVTDTPANLLGLAAQTLSQASAFALSAGGTVSGAQFITLRDTLGVSANGHTLSLSDSAANLLILSGNMALVGATQITGDANLNAAQAQILAAEPGFTTGGHVLTVTDSAANLLGLPTGVQTLSGHLVLSADQSVSAAQASALAALGGAFSTGGHVLTVSDTAANLLSLPSGVAAIAGAYALSADASVSVAQFTALSGTLHVALGGHALVVTDTPANLLTLSQSLLSQASGFALSAGGTVSESQFVWLRDNAGVSGNGYTLSVADTAANLLALSGSLALVSATQLTGSANLSAAQAQILANEPGFSLGGNVLSITDNAANLLALSSGVQTLSGHLILGASQSVNGAQASGLAAFGAAFSTAGSVLTVSDTAVNLLSLPSGVAAIAGAYALSADAVVNAGQFGTLIATLHVGLAGHALIVADTPANLLGLPTQSIPYATGFELSTGGTVSEAQFVSLRDVIGVNANGHSLTVSDTATDLLALSGNLALDGATQLSADGTLNAAQAVSLAGEPGFSTAGHVLTISDTAANLLALPTAVRALSGHLTLSASQSVSAAVATSLAALGAAFSPGGNTLTVSDTAANLLALPSGVAAIAGAYVLSADASVSAAQFTSLRDGLHVSTGGHAITIIDTAPNLAAMTGSMASASAVLLSANGTVSAAGAAVLYADPGFSNAGHTLTIADTVANLLALSTPLQSLANAFSLSASQTLSVAQLAGLAAYGIKFTDGNYSLGVVDTAANLAGLTGPQLALASSETMSQSATINAATAVTLASLPGFALGSGVFMTVQDSAANLLGLPPAVLAVAGSEILPAGAVSLSAAQAAGLYAIANFSTAGATITVTDTVANLSGNAGWSNVATFTHVADTAAILASNAASALVQNATSVTLVANATISASQAALLSTIAGYSTGSYILTVADSGAAIAQNESAIAAVGTSALVNTTAAVSAAQADTLALLSNAGKLNFQAGDSLTVSDTYAALTASANATGVALASNITVADIAANLVSASAHNWGNLVPTYQLSANATISGAQASTLASLSGHLQYNGHTLAVQDSAANVLANASSLTSLGINATVSDTAANIGGQMSALQGLGGRLASVVVTDGSALSGSVAAALSPLAAKLAAPAIAVADNAANIDANVTALHTLGAHVAITLSDSAAAVGAHASDFATLGAALTVSLTDVGATSAAIAAGVATLAARFAAGTSLAVSDTAADIAAQASPLASMGAALGTLTLSGGNAVSVAQAASLLALQSHLAASLAVSGNTAAIVANASALTSLQSDGRLASLTDSGDSAASVVAAASTLNALGASVTVSDTQANIIGNVSALGGITGLSAITVTDVTHPSFALSLSQYSADASVLARVTNTHSFAITDTASVLAADLASGSSVLIGITSPLSIAVTGGAPLVLSQAVAVMPAVASVLVDFSGTLQVTGVDVSHLGAVFALSPSSVAVADTTANIGADLASGSSAILAHIAAISAIAASGGDSISLTASQALTTHVDDNASSVFGKMTGAGLVVTGASVAQVAPLLGLYTTPGSVSVSDTAANITAALTNPSSAILTSPSAILTLHVSNGAPIMLTETQDVAAGVNDSSTAALSKVTGAVIDVTGVTAAQLGTVEGQARVADQISVADTGANIAGALSTLLSDRSNLGAITVTSGVVTLSVVQATTVHVADGAGSLVSLLPGHSYAVTAATVAQIASLIALAQAPATIGVSDTGANVAADIGASGSQILAHAASVTVGGSILSLSDAQAHAIIANGNTAALGLIATGQTIDVSGVPVSDIGTFSGWHSGLAAGVALNLEVSDTALALGTDLGMGGASLLSTDAAYVHSVTLSGAGGTLSTAQLSAVAGISGLNANGITVPVSGNAANIAGLGAAARMLAGTHVAVSDTGANVAAQLGSLQSAYNGQLSITLISGTVSVTAANYTADTATIAAITNAASVVVTGTAASIAGIATPLGGDAHVSAIQITDTAANVAGNITTLGPLATGISVTVTDSSNITAATAQALVGAGFANLSMSGSVGVTDTGSQIAAMAEAGSIYVSFLTSRGAVLSADSNVALLDASALSGLGSHLNKNGHVINVWDTASHLTASGASATLSSLTGSGLVSGIYLKTTGNAVTLTAATALSLLAISGIHINNPDNSANTITVADTAAHLDTNYSALHNNVSINAIVINASATVSVATLSDMQALAATTAAGIALTVSDTAANIVTASGVSGASVQASAWNLSASASVSSANALSLAALSNFSPSGYTLTVALGSNTALGSVAAANQLGALGSALIVTGHYYTIGGSVSALTGLTSAGASVAHVALSDTLANISGLTTPAPLLTGTVAVTDAESLTATQAQGFLALLSAAGVPASNVSFTGGNETVTDTVANLQALEASSAWTGNATLQSHFALVANDTAANLDNVANASFLGGVPSKILSATATVSAANATALATLSGLSLGGHSLIVSDSAANLLASANSSGLALATSINLNGAASLNAAQSEQLLQINHFSLTQTLNIIDSSANLLDGTLQGLIAGHAQVHVALAGSETLNAQIAASLVSLQGFSDTVDMNIVDSSSYLLASGASAAESMAASVALAGNETVSANTVLRLSEIPHFISTDGTLTLASNDYANAPTLKAIADMGSHFTEGGHSLTLTQDDLGLTPTEYAQIQSDGFVANGHVLSAVLVNDSITDTSNTLTLTATGVAGASVTIYDHSGNTVSTTPEGNASFTLTTPDSGATGNFSITETVNSVESAPVVVLTQSTLESYVAGVSANFANSGQIQVGTGEYISLYTAGATLPNAPALVYDPNAHTISLDIPNSSPITLITLGASTHPASLDPSEILIKHHS